MTRKFLIDTDTASDDAVALAMALRWSNVEVLGITVVSGNVPVDQGVRNALYTVELCRAATPVYRGAARPLARDPVHAHFFHGEDGMGNQNYPPPQGSSAEGQAIDFLIESLRANPGTTLVTLGPLTNVALAVSQAPDIVTQVDRCVVMGGAACTVGNVTPAAEYNIWVDPEAARIVFHSGLPIEMVGWELCRKEATVTDYEMAAVRRFGTRLARFALDCNRTAIRAYRKQTGEPGMALPDPVAMAVALESTICTRKSSHFVDIETHSDLTRGMTVIDALDITDDERNQEVWGTLQAKKCPVTVCWEIDNHKWKEMLYKVLRQD